MTDLAQPTVIRRKVAFAEAIYEGQPVEGITGRLSTFETCQKY